MRIPLLSAAAEAWVVFVEERSFTRAAERLHIAQPSLHAKIKKFSQEVDEPLYRREGNAMVITPVGEELANFVRGLQQQRDDFLARLTPTRPLSLLAGEGAYLYLLGPALHAVTRRSETELSFSIGYGSRALTAVRRGRADLAIGVFDELPDNLVALDIATFPQAAACPTGHRLSRATSVSLADLANERLVVPPKGHLHRDRLEEAFRAQGLELKVAVEAEGWELIMRFVMLGVGCAVLHAYVPVKPGISLHPMKDLPHVVYRAVIKQASFEDPAIRRLLDTIAATIPPPAH